MKRYEIRYRQDGRDRIKIFDLRPLVNTTEARAEFRKFVEEERIIATDISVHGELEVSIHGLPHELERAAESIEAILAKYPINPHCQAADAMRVLACQMRAAVEKEVGTR